MKSNKKRGIEGIMRTEKAGLAHTLLSPLCALYAAGITARRIMYKKELLKTKVLPCKVISVGNITVGGSGKTPMTIYIAEKLKYLGFSAVALSRGYKRSTTGVHVVSDKETVLLGVKEAGDEPYLMSKRLPGIPVVVGEKRYEAGLEIIERFAPDVILLDDAFQHISLARNINILLIDASVGFGSGRLLPAGILREPVSAAKRADIIMIKGGELRPDAREQIADLNKVEFNFNYKVEDFTLLHNGTLVAEEANQNMRVLALAALATPDSFISTIEGLGLEISKKCFYQDHHSYTEADLFDILEAANGLDAVVTTEKDAVKLTQLLDNIKEMKKQSPPLYFIRIGVEISNEQEFVALLESSLFFDDRTI